MTDCYVDDDGCLVCPEIPESPGSPGELIIEPILGWNGGANSVATQSGDFILSFRVSAVAGVVCGVRSGRDFPGDPYLVEHGWLFKGVSGHFIGRPCELGVERGPSLMVNPCDAWHVVRRGGRVEYFRNNQLAYVSRRPSWGEKVTTGCLYSTGDVIAPDTCLDL